MAAPEQPLPESGWKGLFSCARNFRFSPPIPLPASPEPPEPLRELGIAIPSALFKGRASCGVDACGRNSPFHFATDELQWKCFKAFVVQDKPVEGDEETHGRKSRA